MTTQLIILRDKHSTPTYLRSFTDSGYDFLLAATTEITVSAPSDARGMLLEYASASASDALVVYVSESTITIPANDTPAASGAELNPPTMALTGGETLFFKAVSSAYVRVSFYKLPD